MEYIIVEKKEKYAILTINRPKALNALNPEVLKEMKEAIEDLEKDENVRAVIVTGSGEKAFVAGADISEMVNFDPVQAYEFAKLGQNIYLEIENSKKPYIAAVNGFALGGGCELSLACDIRIASQNAKFALPETTLGIIPGYGGTQRLPKAIGLGRAKEMAVTGSMIDASTADKWGLVNKVVDSDNLLVEAISMATKISRNSRHGIASALEAVNKSRVLSIEDGLELEALLFTKLCTLPDKAEGMTAFVEKRKPNFK